MKCPNIKIYKCSDGFVTDNAQVAKSHETNIKSNKLKCPFCQQELEKRHAATTDYNSMFITYYCRNPECESTTDLIGCKEFWDILGQLIRTHKALEIAKTHLGYIKNNYHSWTPYRDEQMIAQASNCLAKIQELEDDNL